MMTERSAIIEKRDNMKTINEMIDSLTRETCEILATLKKLRETDYAKDYKNFSYLVDRLNKLYEKGACEARDFSINTNVYTPSQLYDNVTDTLGIEIYKHENMVIVDLPFILPKKKDKQNFFIGNPLRHKFEQVRRDVDLKVKEKAVICVIHIYSNEKKKARCYDYDNLESKKVLDIITLYTIPDDSPEYCDVYQTMKLGSENKTRIIVLPKSEFGTKIPPEIKENLMSQNL